jgi:hypothetical protein
MSTDSQPYHEPPIKFIVSPELAPIGSGEPTTVGNSTVYSQIGPFDRPLVSRTNPLKQTYTLPMTHGFQGMPGSGNPACTGLGNVLREGIVSRPLKSEKNTCENPARLPIVDAEIVQNAGQFDEHSVAGRDLLSHRICLNGGGNILWSLTRGGTSTRVMERNITNLCN